MRDSVHTIDSPRQILSAAQELRQVGSGGSFPVAVTLEIFERWSAALDAASVRQIPGLAFLRLWLRRSTLEPIICRELGSGALENSWQQDGRAQLGTLPLGVIGHWPAGNIEIQPILSLTCALLGGNTCLVRVPTRLVEPTQLIFEKLLHADPAGILASRIFFAAFDHLRTDLQQAMARSVDGAMIWGGEDAVNSVRALPFPHWARVLVFGPRVSAAAMDASIWADRKERSAWCRRLARDVWQFDQGACSSPQTLFLERNGASDPSDFVADLAQAFTEENRAHPRTEIEPGAASAVAQARASWLLTDTANTARFPASPDWTILAGNGVEMPKPTQSRTLTVLFVDDLITAISRFDGSVQTLGLAITDPQRESAIADAASRHGVDRIVKIGQMHTFGSPWDGMDLIRPMTRVVRYLPSSSNPLEHSNGRCAAVSGSAGS